MINLDLKECTFYELLISSCAGKDVCCRERSNFSKLKHFAKHTFFPDFLRGFNFADFREFNQNPRNPQNLIPAKLIPIKVNSSKKLLLFGERTIETTISFSKRLLKFSDIKNGEWFLQDQKLWIFDREFGILSLHIY